MSIMNNTGETGRGRRDWSKDKWKRKLKKGSEGRHKTRDQKGDVRQIERRDHLLLHVSLRTHSHLLLHLFFIHFPPPSATFSPRWKYLLEASLGNRVSKSRIHLAQWHTYKAASIWVQHTVPSFMMNIMGTAGGDITLYFSDTTISTLINYSSLSWGRKGLTVK